LFFLDLVLCPDLGILLDFAHHLCLFESPAFPAVLGVERVHPQVESRQDELGFCQILLAGLLEDLVVVAHPTQLRLGTEVFGD
jgi:hypothetical protein